jgi:hypothetical protein
MAQTQRILVTLVGVAVTNLADDAAAQLALLFHRHHSSTVGAVLDEVRNPVRVRRPYQSRATRPR